MSRRELIALLMESPFYFCMVTLERFIFLQWFEAAYIRRLS
jgi:hypothetical protein